MRHILCPIDFSKTAINALEYSVSIAEKHGSTLSLVYVFTEEDYNERLSQGVKDYEYYEAEYQKKLNVILDELAISSINMSAHVLNGNVLLAIQEFVKVESVDLIVTGTKGASDVFDKMVGSNTVKMLDHLDVPVLAVPKKARFSGMKKIVYGTNYAEEDKVAISELVNFCNPWNSEITILHLSKRDNIIGEALFTNFQEELSGFVDCDKLIFEKKKYVDNVALEIDQYMMEQKSDVLALLMEKQNLVDRLFHQSVTKSLSYMLDFPMLVYKMESY